MSGSKALFGCVLVACFAGWGFPGEARSAEGENSAKSAPKVEQPFAEKPPVATGPAAAAEQDASDKLCQCVGRSQSAMALKIEQALAGPLHSVGLDYTEQPLQDVVAQMSDDYGIPIQLDRIALEEAGIGFDVPVTVSIHRISLRSGLKLMLRSLDLTWMLRDEVLMITTKQGAEKDLDTCVYNVQGLVDDADPKSVKALVDAICGCVQRESWAANGRGHAEVRPLPSGLLVVSQTQAAHEEVSALLSRIRKMREQAPLEKVRSRAAESAPVESKPSAAQQPKPQAVRQAAGDQNPFD